MSRVLGIVPARGGSKRVPRKNVRPLGGRPLVSWALDAASAAGSLSCVVLSSDDPEILAIGGRHRGVVPIERPAALATDTAPAIDYVRHALSVLETEREPRFDAIVIVQPSSPFTTAADIDACVERLFLTGSDSVVTVEEVQHAVHPLKLKQLQGDKLVAFWEDEHGRMAQHELPRLYVRNGSVYASARRTIEGGSILGDDSRAVVMPRERSIDVNDELDLAFAEFLLGRQP